MIWGGADAIMGTADSQLIFDKFSKVISCENMMFWENGARNIRQCKKKKKKWTSISTTPHIKMNRNVSQTK